MSFFIDEIIKEIEDTKRAYYCFTISADEKVKALQKALKKTDYCILQVHYYGVFQLIVGKKENAKGIFDFHHLYCILCCSEKYTPRYVDNFLLQLSHIFTERFFRITIYFGITLIYITSFIGEKDNVRYSTISQR